MIVAYYSGFKRNNGENIYQCPKGKQEVKSEDWGGEKNALRLKWAKIDDPIEGRR